MFASNQDLRSFFSISSLLHSRYLFGDLLQLFLSDMFPNLHMVLLCLFRLTEQVTCIYSFILGNGVENSVCANLTSSKGDQSEGRNRQEIALNCLIEHDPYHGGGGAWVGALAWLRTVKRISAPQAASVETQQTDFERKQSDFDEIRQFR